PRGDLEAARRARLCGRGVWRRAGAARRDPHARAQPALRTRARRAQGRPHCRALRPASSRARSSSPASTAGSASPRARRTSRWGRRALAAVLTTRAVRRAAFALMRQLGGARWVRRLARRRGSLWLAYAAALPDATRPPGLPSSVLEPEGQPRGTAVLLTGCVAETAFGRTNVATARLLQRAGVRVLVPRGQGCCGALALHPGAVERARLPARGCAVVPGPSGA